MAIKIVLPKAELGGPKTAAGTRFYTASGEEITNVMACKISIMPNEMVTASLTIAISEIEGLEGIDSEVENIGLIKSQLNKLGYEVTKK